MPIGPINRARHFSMGEGPRSDGLRNPDVNDLPRVGGRPISSVDSKIMTIYAQFLGIKSGGDEIMKKVKKVESALLASDQEYKKCVGELADAFLVDLKGDHSSDLEPFEVYAEKVRQDFYLKSKDFKERFINGFEVLQDQSIKDDWAKMDQKDPPPGAITL